MFAIEHFLHAEKVIKEKIIKTPLVFSPTFSREFGGDIYLKLENLQKTGSFKIRGATYKLHTSLGTIGSNGVVAASAGNHAQGVALAAKLAGIKSTIVMPEWASISKQEATRHYGGEVVIFGQSIRESLEKAGQLAQKNRTFIHPFDDPDIILGQGTIALEILNDLDNIGLIIVPVGGGGLISGIAAAAKAVKPDIKVVGVQTSACPSAYKSITSGKIKAVQLKPSIADGISVRQTGEQTFALMRKYVDDIVLVEEEQIASAVLTLLERKKVLAEGAGAVPLAAMINSAVSAPKKGKTVLVISGGNVDSPLLGRIVNKGLIKNGRIVRLSVHLEDRPGALARLLERVAAQKANVLQVYHDRNVKSSSLYTSVVNLELETRGHLHIKQIKADLKKAGFSIAMNTQV